MTDQPPPPTALRARCRAWLDQFVPGLPRYAGDPHDFSARMASLRQLQAALFEAGWARYGWPAEYGGLGGDARHRAVISEELAMAGLGDRGAFEHLEILAPALVAHWEPSMVAEMLPRLLAGTDVWCQGFSEPDAGSDLTSLRTTAVKDGDRYVVDGTKIWTSWAADADRCVVLARTGPALARHRGLSAFFVDLDTPGVSVRALRQANGIDELAEVTFDGVVVDERRLIGAEGAGWSIALDILSCERSAFAWLRHTRLYERADVLADVASEPDDRQLGELALDLFALRLSSAGAVDALAAGGFAGPGAARTKVLLTDAEQHLYDTARQILGPSLMVGGDVPELQEWQDEYLFSRIVSVYGGTRQMQLTTIARFLLGLAAGTPR